jgi:hypothetical protein
MAKYSNYFFLVLLTLVGAQHKFIKDLNYDPEAKQNYNDRPMLGFLTQPVPYTDDPKFEKYSSYVAVEYVEYLESVGVRICPLIYHGDISRNLELLRHINGLVIPGGKKNSEYGRFAS